MVDYPVELMKKLIHETPNLDFPLALYKTGKHHFSVVYGKQVIKDLNYEAAAEEYGLSLFHALGCQGKLD